ncbi:NAD(P)/FAD-dependent oxidoreductase [Fructilactobacillus cliffordii]|uniref:NAD(P)/FAD-dependent oxidoreductase n=1 Tax=Fructilactobacillus cliffordii TaxID=2940299 RepID=UPI00209368DF|nr:NAD(P)/FAD-dependent oxidoreductase [Fructilactobacillus cliffordii]USS86055.1 NAD(P)/FAD-dependent oxidoreductase [Fructilactobacillus cliffordii]
MKKVLVIGAGFAGLRACKRLAKSKQDLEVTLVDRTPYHYDSTQLYRVAAGSIAPEKIMFRIEDIISPKIKFIQDEVQVINGKQNTVTLANHRDISYDYLFNALGFEPETFNTPGADTDGLQISNIENSSRDAKALQDSLAKYAQTKDPKYLSILTVGGGFTSIELLGELVHMVPTWAKKYGFQPNELKITCVAPAFLGMFNEKQSTYAKRYLEKKGVNFILGSNVNKVTDDGVYYGQDNQFLPAANIFWTAGVKGSDVIAASGYDQHRNRVAVNDDMSLQAYPNQYLIGDVSAVKDPTSGQMYPTTAQISIYEASNAVANLENKLAGKSVAPFNYHSLGTVCSLGPHNAVADVSMLGLNVKINGFIAAVVKNIIFKRSSYELSGLKMMLQS